MWLDLHRGILEEFASLSEENHHTRDFSYRLRVVEPWANEGDPWRLQRRRQSKRARLLSRREALAGTRPPCPHCGGPVERMGTTGTLPKYCTPKCMRAAKVARWREKHQAPKAAA